MDLGFCTLAKGNFFHTFLSYHDLWPIENEEVEQGIWTQSQEASN